MNNPKDSQQEKSPKSTEHLNLKDQSYEVLLKAIEEMELLLAHSTQAGIVVPTDRLKVLVKAKRAARLGNIDEEVEISFWQEYQELGKQLQPITVDSLKATGMSFGVKLSEKNSIPWRRNSHSSRAVLRYQILSIAALFILLLAQVYTIFGSSTINEIQALDRRIEEEQIKIEGLLRRSAPLPPKESRDFESQIRVSDSRLERFNNRRDANYELLSFWFPFKIDTGEYRAVYNSGHFQTSKIILEFLSKYLLPLLYGLLGACVYVLRTLSKEIKLLIYTAESDIRFQLRIYLGALAGFAIGWLITPENSPAIFRSVTPIALAFVAGYSVELLFSAMDTIIEAFTKQNKG